MPGFYRGSRLSGERLLPKPIFTGESSLYQHNEYDCMKLLTSGTLTLDRIGPFDVFAVGGGGRGGCIDQDPVSSDALGGGGGGYTGTLFNFIPTNGKEDIIITVGVGGSGGSGAVGNVEEGRGGSSSFGSYLVAEGGFPGGRRDNGAGGNGGSGGGYSRSQTDQLLGAGGSDGSDGSHGVSNPSSFNGKGQHTTTRAFQDPTEALYAGGGGGKHPDYIPPGKGGAGGGGGNNNTGDGETNTGGGGAGRSSSLANGARVGGSGIVIIRWKAR